MTPPAPPAAEPMDAELSDIQLDIIHGEILDGTDWTQFYIRKIAQVFNQAKRVVAERARADALELEMKGEAILRSKAEQERALEQHHHDATKRTAEAMAAELEQGLEEVCKVLESNTTAIVDTVWVSDGRSETLLDYCHAALRRPDV